MPEDEGLLSEEAAADAELKAAEAEEAGSTATAEPDSAAPEALPGTPLPAGARVFFVAKADGKEERSAVLRIGHTLQGQIKDGNGENASEAELMLVLETGETLRGVCDSNGHFVFAGLPECQAILIAATKPLKKKLAKRKKVSFHSSPVMAAACVVTKTSFHGFGIKWSFPPDKKPDAFFGQPWELAWLDGLSGALAKDWKRDWNDGVVATVLGPRIGAVESDCGVMLGGSIDAPETSTSLKLVDLFARS